MSLTADIERALADTRTYPPSEERDRALDRGAAALLFVGYGEDDDARASCLAAARAAGPSHPMAAIWRSVLLANPR